MRRYITHDVTHESRMCIKVVTYAAFPASGSVLKLSRDFKEPSPPVHLTTLPSTTQTDGFESTASQKYIRGLKTSIYSLDKSRAWICSKKHKRGFEREMTNVYLHEKTQTCIRMVKRKRADARYNANAHSCEKTPMCLLSMKRENTFAGKKNS